MQANRSGQVSTVHRGPRTSSVTRTLFLPGGKTVTLFSKFQGDSKGYKLAVQISVATDGATDGVHGQVRLKFKSSRQRYVRCRCLIKEYTPRSLQRTAPSPYSRVSSIVVVQSSCYLFCFFKQLRLPCCSTSTYTATFNLVHGACCRNDRPGCHLLG